MFNISSVQWTLYITVLVVFTSVKKKTKKKTTIEIHTNYSLFKTFTNIRREQNGKKVILHGFPSVILAYFNCVKYCA